MKQIEVQIMGQSYRLGAPDGGDQRLLKAVGRVDEAMCQIRDAGKIKARERIAVLAALNLAYDLDERTPPAAEPRAARATPMPSDAGDQPSLTGLIARLDAVLGEDGRLI